MRSGYTTGACAAAAAKAATLGLIMQKTVHDVEITLPLGQTARFEVASCTIESERATCSVIKDAGDDPDVTNGAEIGAIVEWSDEASGVNICGGKGVGVITKPGLGLEIGAPAINPVPREMITRAVNEALSFRGREDSSACRGGRPCPPLAGQGGNLGVQVTIFVPRGEQIAKKTLNARLGIIGGISILGTTGIVVPYSTAAYRACIAQALDVARANSCGHIVLTTGRRSEKFAQTLLALPEEAFVQVADFSGFAIRQCVAKGFHTVTFSGMIGKLSKIAAGATQTHVDSSRLDHGFLADLAAEAGLPSEVVAAIRDGNTARQFAEIVAERGATAIFTRICELAARNLAKTAGLGALQAHGSDEESDALSLSGTTLTLALSGRERERSMVIDCIMTDFDGKVMGRAAIYGNRPNHRRR